MKCPLCRPMPTPMPPEGPFHCRRQRQCWVPPNLPPMPLPFSLLLLAVLLLCVHALPAAEYWHCLKPQMHPIGTECEKTGSWEACCLAISLSRDELWSQ